MDKPRIFLGSSGKQEKLLHGLTRGLEDVAHVEPWTTSFNPGTTTLERLLELDGLWWQFSLTELGPLEPSAVSLIRISRDRDGALELAGRSWQEDGRLSARYWCEASKERKEPSGVFYYWKGERPRDSNAPRLEGTGEILLESADRASGYFTTRSDTPANVNARTAGVFWRADPEDMSILDGGDDRQRAALIAERLRLWKSITNA
jgi:hypothetical protein